MSDEQTLDLAPSSENNTKTFRKSHDKKKSRKSLIKNRTCLKASTPELQDDCFMTL